MNYDTRKRHDTDRAMSGQFRSGTGEEHTAELGDSIAETVVFAVSALTDTDPIKMEPLHGIVDVDALEELFAPKADGTPRGDGIISFTYCGCEVTVQGNERVYVESGSTTDS